MSRAAADLDLRLADHLRSSGWLDRAAAVVVGASGGLDSMTLLHLMRFGRRVPKVAVHAVHVDHRMRPDSAEDAAWVAERCAEWGVGCRVQRAAEPVESEARGRELRYNCFAEAARELGDGAVAMTAHTADDQAETVLFRAARGSGPRGLGGIRPALWSMPAGAGPEPQPKAAPDAAPALVRPLLPFRRAEIGAFAAARGIPHREDPTNRDARWTRNRLRREVLPLLEEAVPGAAGALAALAGLSRAETAALDELADRRIGELAAGEAAPGELRLDLDAVRALSDPVLAVVLRRAAARMGAGLGRRATAALARFARRAGSGRRMAVAGGVVVERRLDELRVAGPGRSRRGGPEASAEAARGRSREGARGVGGEGVSAGRAPIEVGGAAQPADSALIEGGRGSAEIACGGAAVRVAWGPEPCPGFASVAEFSPDAVPFPLAVRAREPGDRMAMPYGRKKVKKVLLEARIAADERGRVPVVADAEGSVVWIPGVAAAASVRPGRDGPVRGERGLGAAAARGAEGGALWVCVDAAGRGEEP